MWDLVFRQPLGSQPARSALAQVAVGRDGNVPTCSELEAISIQHRQLSLLALGRVGEVPFSRRQEDRGTVCSGDRQRGLEQPGLVSIPLRLLLAVDKSQFDDPAIVATAGCADEADARIIGPLRQLLLAFFEH